MPDYTRRLAAFAAELTFEQLPAAAVAHAKLCLLDTIGCGLYGSTLPWSRIVADCVMEMEKGVCTLWGSSCQASPTGAALVNGTAIHAFELDDLHKESIVHPGSVVVSAALATAEAQGGINGQQFLTAMVAGYEICARVGISMGSAHLIQGWHPTGTHGTLGAAAASGNLLHLSAECMLHAIGTAGSQSGGLMASQFSSMVKRFHAGRAAQSGVYSAMLAARGFTGITNLFESEYGGYLSTFSPRSRPEKLISGLGEVWEIETIGFKPYATNGSCQPAIDALLHLRAEHHLKASDVSAIRIQCSTATKEHVGWEYRPDSATTAQMNLPYICAVTITDGAAFVDQFTAERISDPALVELASRVTVMADPAIDAAGEGHRHLIRMEVELYNGLVLRAERQHAKGSKAQPLTDAEIRAKYAKLAAKALPASRLSELEQLVDRIDQVKDIGLLSQMLRL